MRIIGYERVSTARQGASGLGIEAQRQAIEGFVAQQERDPDRPLHRGRERPQPGPAGARQGAAPRQGHRGDAGDRQARPAVAQRRLPADAAGQRREVRRGRPAGGERPHRRDHGAGGAAGARGDLAGAPRRRWRWPGAAGCGSATPTARRRSGGLARAVRRSGRPLRATPTGMPRTWRRWSTDIRAGGATSLRAIAGELNARGMLTRRGGRWHVSTVMNLLDRLGAQGGGMRQSRLMSLVEAVTNVVGRLRLAVGDAAAGVPAVRAGGDAAAEPRIGAIFTLVSLVRGYLLRRVFEAIPARSQTSR